MKSEIKILLNHQSEWQKNRSKLSWSEKLHQAVILRNAALALRKNNTNSANAVAEERAEYGKK